MYEGVLEVNAQEGTPYHFFTSSSYAQSLPREQQAPIQGACHCRAEQPPIHLQSPPGGRQALPSISRRAGRVLLPPWPHRLPSFPSLQLLTEFRPCTARRATSLPMWGSAQEVSQLGNMFLLFFPSTLKKKPKQNRNKTTEWEELGLLHLQNRSPSTVDQEKIGTLLESSCSQLPT